MIVLATSAVAAKAGTSTEGPRPAEFLVGFAKVDITPAQLPFDYLGGEGYQRVGTTVSAPLWVRSIAIGAADRSGRLRGQPVVLSEIDAQGWFAGYQSGAGGAAVADYGLDQIRAAAAAAGHLPAADIVISSTHSHTAPDGMGIWGGSPLSYLEQVKAAAVASITTAVDNMRPAWLRHGSADGSKYVYNPIPTGVPPNDYSDPRTWPVYGQLTVLQALAWGTTQPIATLFDFGVHPDILEGLSLISPDWPATVIQHVAVAYGGDAMFVPGTIGEEPVFPNGDTQPHTTALLLQQDALYAQEVSGVVDRAIAVASPVTVPGVAASTVRVEIPGTNALLLGDDIVDVPDEVHSALGLGQVWRAIVPPYLAGNVVGTWAAVVRIGDGALLATPGESYSDVYFSARDQIRANWYLIAGLADDQLGYFVLPAEWTVANAYGIEAPAALYSIGATEGADIVRGLEVAAARVGFAVRMNPTDLVSDQDPVVAQMQYCVTSGACQAGLP